MSGIDSGAASNLHEWHRDRAPSAVRPQQIYCTYDASSELFDSDVLLCDPLTRLVAYPSFERHLVLRLPELASRGLHLAIGDVDDLKAYVNKIDQCDPTHFGHLAGNLCMRLVGTTTRLWAEQYLAGWPFSICATFGGDEVIIAAAGRSYAAFCGILGELRNSLCEAAPATTSFAIGSLQPRICNDENAYDLYRYFVSAVDCALFEAKAEIRARNQSPCGYLNNVGIIDSHGKAHFDDVNHAAAVTSGAIRDG